MIRKQDVNAIIDSYIHEIITESGTDKNAHTNKILRQIKSDIDNILTLEQEPCEDAVSREELLEEIYIWGGDTETLIEYIKGMPSATPTQEPILDKIRAEIANLDDADYDYEGYYKAVTDALKIIDKYKADMRGEEDD